MDLTAFDMSLDWKLKLDFIRYKMHGWMDKFCGVCGSEMFTCSAYSLWSTGTCL